MLRAEVDEAGAVPRKIVPGKTVVVVVLVDVLGGKLVGRVVTPSQVKSS